MADKTTSRTASSVWKRAVFFTLKAFIGFGIALIGFEVAIQVHPPLLSWGLAMAGRSEACPPGQALSGTEQRALWGPYAKRIEAESKMLEQDDSGLQRWQTPLGAYWIPAGTVEHLPNLLAQQQSGIYDNEANGVRPGDIVLDCGAHVGVYVRTAIDAGAKKVVAIEPAPENIECLRRNFKAEIATGQVVVYPKGVWDADAALPLYQDPTNSAADSFIIKGPNDVVANEILLTTIDKLSAELGLERVDLIKMDIKGAIERALTGGRETILRDRPRLVLATEEEEDDPGAVSDKVASFGLGYQSACGACSVAADFTVAPVVMFFN